MSVTLGALRRYALARSLFTPTTLPPRDVDAQFQRGKSKNRFGGPKGEYRSAQNEGRTTSQPPTRPPRWTRWLT